MARFTVTFVNSAKIGFEEIKNLRGRKISNSQAKRTFGEEETKKYDYYHISSPNKYGIRWVTINKNSWHGSNIVATKKLPQYYRIQVIRMYDCF